MDHIDKLHQNGTVTEYIKKFMYLINQTSDVSELIKVHLFRKNLKPSISSEIRYQKPKTLNEACNIATEYEASYSRRSSQRADFNEVYNTSTKGQDNKYCTFCKKKGHIYKECYKLKNRNKNNGNKSNNQSNDNNNKAETNNSNKNNGNNNQQNNKNVAKKPETETNKSNIPKPSNMVDIRPVNTIDMPDFLTTTAIIDGNDVEVMFDTGAKMSVIAYQVVKKFNIPFHKTNQQCSLGNGSIDRIIGITEPVHVILKGSICEMEFMILPRHNTLLGIDWFNTVKAHVETYNNRLVFAKREYILNPGETDDEVEVNLTDMLQYEL